MAVRCSKCGEELLGPVNRCWKCGQTFATLPDAGGLPPVRTEPIPAAAPLVVMPQAMETPAAAPLLADDAAAPLAPAEPRIRTGSPFSPGAAVTAVSQRPAAMINRPKPPATQDLIRDHVAVAGAIGSLVLGGFGLAVSWMQNPTAVIGGAVIAVLGLGMGMWGLHSRRRGWALFGMLICVAAISLASYSGAMLIYEARQQAKEMEGLLE